VARVLHQQGLAGGFRRPRPRWLLLLVLPLLLYDRLQRRTLEGAG